MLTETVSFRINFPYKGYHFGAAVHKYQVDPVKYLVLLDREKNWDVNIPLVICFTVDNGILRVNDPAIDKGLVSSVTAGILDYCNENYIPIG
jgi:hypothetical protein